MWIMIRAYHVSRGGHQTNVETDAINWKPSSLIGWLHGPTCHSFSLALASWLQFLQLPYLSSKCSLRIFTWNRKNKSWRCYMISMARWFYRFNHTPVIMASGRELCYVLLSGVCLCYAMTFVILARPTVISCALLRVGLGENISKFIFEWVPILSPLNLCLRFSASL